MIHSAAGGAALDVRVVPRAGRPGIDGTRDGALLVRLSAAPVDGAANAQLVEVLSTALDVPRSRISVIAGERSRRKRVLVRGLDAEELSARIGAART